MVKLAKSLGDWQSDTFAQTLKEEVGALKSDVLPLAQAIDDGNYVDDSDIGVNVIAVEDDEDLIKAHIGVFFAQIISCCSCGESEPVDEAYAEMIVSIDKTSAEAGFSVLPS